MSKEKNKCLAVIAGLTYTITALITVISAWIIGLHRFDLSYTISFYVAFRSWTAVLYGICGIIMVSLLFRYVFRINISKLKKIIYSIIIGSVLGCTLFPCNYSWSHSISDIHNLFATILFLFITAAFIIMLIKPKNKKQRIFALIATIFAIFYITCYFMPYMSFYDNLQLIWENIFIYLLLGMLILENN